MREENETINEELSDDRNEQEQSMRDIIEAQLNATEESGSEEERGSKHTSSEEQVRTPKEQESREAATAREEQEQRDRARDERGRFASEDKAVAKQEGEQQREEEPLRAPQAWKVTAREHWKNLPKEVQEEVSRRELHLQRTLDETTVQRNIAEGFINVVKPYQAIIRSEGSNPLQAVDEMFKTAYALRMAPPPTKARLVAQMVQQFGVDVGMLDQALAGSLGPQANHQHQQPMQPPRDPRVDQLFSVLQRNAEQKQQARLSEATTELAEFSKTHDFVEDVRDEMADLIEVAAKRGKVMTYEQAYNIATANHPDISKVLEQRRLAEGGGNSNGSTRRARRASSSVRSSPAGGTVRSQPGDTLRGAIEDAIENAG